MLSTQQITQFQEDGYLVLTDAFSPRETERVRDAALDIVADFDPDKHRTVFETTDRDAGRDDYFFDSAEAVHCFLEAGALDEGGELVRPKELAINKIGHAMHDLVPAFTEFCRLPVIAETLRDIGYRQASLWQTMYIFKQPGIGGEVRWHQDASYLVSEPPRVTGLWIAIEDAGLENGCLWVQPGGHRSPLREIYEVDWEHRKGMLRTLDDTPWPAQDEAVPLEVPRGSLVLFSDHMPHYSSQNHSKRSRHALTLHVTERGAQWPEFNWLQRKNLGEFLL
ncbi:MAG: phytanoyl-CoA dioxygenase family protein [Xanthomonadales bacterium]|nr:phytanoyl-CoA dioxygenase family protein [Xanthomonadales bacterium]